MTSLLQKRFLNIVRETPTSLLQKLIHRLSTDQNPPVTEDDVLDSVRKHTLSFDTKTGEVSDDEVCDCFNEVFEECLMNDGAVLVLQDDILYQLGERIFPQTIIDFSIPNYKLPADFLNFYKQTNGLTVDKPGKDMGEGGARWPVSVKVPPQFLTSKEMRPSLRNHLEAFISDYSSDTSPPCICVNDWIQFYNEDLILIERSALFINLNSKSENWGRILGYRLGRIWLVCDTFSDLLQQIDSATTNMSNFETKYAGSICEALSHKEGSDREWYRTFKLHKDITIMQDFAN